MDSSMMQYIFVLLSVLSPTMALPKTLQAPGKVRDLNVTSVHTTNTTVTVAVSFSSPQNPNGVITHYMLSYFLDQSNLYPNNPACQVLTQIYNKTGIIINAKSTDNGFYSKTVEVSPDSRYYFQVTAYNSLAGSPAEFFFFTGIQDSGPVRDLQINTTSDSVFVTWRHPSQPNGFLLGYVLEITRPKEWISCIENLILHCKEMEIHSFEGSPWCGSDYRVEAPLVITNPLSYLFTRLLPYTNYTLKIAAINLKGYGDVLTLNFRTDESEPGDVGNLRVAPMGNNYTTVNVTFTRPQRPNGVIIRYILNFYMLSPGRTNPACQVLKQITGRTDITIYANSTDNIMYSQIVEVSPETEYTFRVTAFNSLKGIPREVNYTTESSVPGNVTDLQVNSSSTSAWITWRSPTQPNGFLLGYRVQLNLGDVCLRSTRVFCEGEKLNYVQVKYHYKCTPLGLARFQNHDIDGNNGGLHDMAVAHLFPYTNYSITVSAFNSKGDGPGQKVAFMTEIGEPDEPKDFHAIVNSSLSITLFWTPSKRRAGPTNYIIVVYGNLDQRTNNYTKVEILNITGYQTTSTVVTYLLSYTYYNFSIMASTVAGHSACVTLNRLVRTGTGIEVPAEPSDFNAIVNSLSTITLYWTPSKHHAGPTNYTVVVYGNVDRGTTNFTEGETYNVYGYHSSSLVVTNLHSYTYYNFTIMASTSTGHSACVALNKIVQTGMGVFFKQKRHFLFIVFSTNCTKEPLCYSVSPYIVNISWTPSKYKAGPTTYLVKVYGELDQGSGVYTSVQSLNVQGFTNTTLIVQDLLSYTNYRFTIRASTSAGESTTTDTVVRTQPRAADPPQSLKVENITASSVRLSWVASNHQCGVTDYIVDVEEQPHLQAEFYILNRTITVHGFHSITVDIANLMSYWKYKFSVRARTQVRPDSASVTAEKQTLQSPPGRVENIQVSALPDNYTAVKLTWDCPEERERHGPISHYTVQYSDKTKTVGDFPDGDSCRETHNSILPVHPKNTYVFTIFASTLYDGLKSTSLPFYAKAGQPTTELHIPTEYVSTAASETLDKSTGSSDVAAIVGGVMASIVVVGLVIGVLLFRRSRNRNTDYGSFKNPVEEDEREMENSIIRAKKIREFTKVVEDHHKGVDVQFSQEWLEISRSSTIHSSLVASSEINRPKNCDVNILAYDHTRVKLLRCKEETGSDYINANYIQGYSGPKDYIASQGQMTATVEDFWQMVWEQKVTVIVQLTDVYEEGRRMLATYWPDNLNERVSHGEITLEVCDTPMVNRRTIKVSLGSESRTVKHFGLQNWQNNDLKPREIIDFAKQVRNALERNNEGPMVVHCSDGVGRTGTFICVDYFLQVIDKADLDDSIDIFSFVLKMRNCRPMTVQSESQYVFIHDIVKEMIQAKLRRRAGKGEEVVYTNQAFEEFDEEEPRNSIPM